MDWNGFTEQDFDIFSVEGFANRMPLLRQEIKPKLTALGEILLEPLAGVVSQTLYPHVAQHLRRTVNAPEETWVAFAKEKRAYKPFVHLRVAISGNGVRVTVFVEDYAEEKEAFAQHLKKNATALSRLFAEYPEIRAYDMPDAKGNPKQGKALTAKALREFATRMSAVKSQHAVFGILLPVNEVLTLSPVALQEWVLASANTLLPLYKVTP